MSAPPIHLRIVLPDGTAPVRYIEIPALPVVGSFIYLCQDDFPDGMPLDLRKAAKKTGKHSLQSTICLEVTSAPRFISRLLFPGDVDIDEGYRRYRCELIEVDVVPVPANLPLQ